MENRAKKSNGHYVWLMIIMIFFGINFFDLAAQELISFDIVTPTTWYEKGLNSLLYVWNKVRSGVADNGVKITAIDFLLGRLAYAQFCIEKMQQEKRRIIDEDILYLYTVLKTIEGTLTHSSDNAYPDNDYMTCLFSMLTATKNRLILFYPSVITP